MVIIIEKLCSAKNVLKIGYQSSCFVLRQGGQAKIKDF